MFIGLFGMNSMTETVHMVADEMEWVETYLKVIPISMFGYLIFLYLIGCPLLIGCAVFWMNVLHSIIKLCCTCCYFCCPRKSVKLWRRQVQNQGKQKANLDTKVNDGIGFGYCLLAALVRIGRCVYSVMNLCDAFHILQLILA